MALVFLLFERLAIILFLSKVHTVIYIVHIIVHHNYLCNLIYCSRDHISEWTMITRGDGRRNSAIFSGVMSWWVVTARSPVISVAECRIIWGNKRLADFVCRVYIYHLYIFERVYK